MISNLKHIALLVSLFLFATQQIFAQVSGWDKTKQGSDLVYVPTDLAPSKTYKVVIPEPVHLNGQNFKSWFLTSLKKMQKPLGDPLYKWIVKTSNHEGLSSSNIFKNKQGKKLNVGYIGINYPNKQAYIVQMVFSLDEGILKKYTPQIPKLLKDARNNRATIHTAQTNTKKTATKIPKPLTRQEKRLAIKRAIRTTAAKGVKTAEIQTIWVDSWLNVLVGGISVDTYLLLKDGSVYTALEIPANELSVAQSKKLEPKKWTKWKKVGSGYQIFNKKEGVWKKLDGNRIRKPKSGEKLNATYLSASGSQLSGSHRSWITFKPNGRFELKNISMMGSPDGSIGPSTRSVHESDKEGTSSTTVISGKDVGGGTTSKKKDGSKNTGSYSIKGNTITLKHDNGYKHTELFFFDKTNKKSFILEDDRYWIDDRKK